MVSVDVKHHVYLLEVSLLFSPAKEEQEDVSEGVCRVGVQAVSERPPFCHCRVVLLTLLSFYIKSLLDVASLLGLLPL